MSEKIPPYKVQLRMPEWIEKSAQLKAEAGWKCELCPKRQGVDGAELSIHHVFYVSCMPLWKYPRQLMMCLCDGCHKKRQKVEQQIYINVADVMRDMTTDQLMNQPIFAMFQ